jgi:hypothetical protein
MKYRAKRGLYKAQTSGGMQRFSPNAIHPLRLTKAQKEGFAKAVKKLGKVRRARKAKI